MLSPVGLLPLNLACQLLVPQSDSSLVNIKLDTSIPKLATEIPDGYTVFPDIGVAYKFYKTPILWNAARRYCETHGATLAVIDSYKKIEYLSRIITGSSDVHVGIHRLFDSTEWTDLKNGSAAAGLPWDTQSYVREMTRNCVGLYNNKKGLYATACDYYKSFACEIPIFKN